MINFNKKDSVSEAAKEIMQKHVKINTDIEYNKDEAEETPARKSHNANGGEINKPELGIVTKEEIEQIDEISKSTLGSYVKNAARDMAASRSLAKDFERDAKSAKKPNTKDINTSLSNKFIKNASKRNAGIGKAVERLTREEMESVDEALKGNQHKIDKNHNNKIDAQDFKILRAKKSLKSFKEQYEENSILDQMINEVLSKDASAGAWIHDFVHSDNPKFAGKSKAKRKEMALAAYYAKQKNEEVEIQECESLEENFELINEISVGAKIRAYANHSRDAYEHGDMGNDDEADHHNSRADKIIAHIKKHHGKEAVKHAERAAHSAIFGHPDHEHAGKDVLSGGLRSNKNLTKAGKVPKNTVSAMKNKVMAYGKPRNTAGPKSKLPEEVEQIDEKLNQKKKTIDTLKGREEVPAGTHNQHSDTKVELNSEGWDDMVKNAKDAVKSGPKPSGGSGIKKGTRYGGSNQKDNDSSLDGRLKDVEELDGKKKQKSKVLGSHSIEEGKRPEDDSVPFAPPFNTTSSPANIKDKSGAVHTPMSRAKNLAKLAMKRVKSDLGKK